ncbi:MAG: hypothetical protein JNM96_01515, partial [Bacteroidia bacterium]|nr:hypothetical protein [Bacteroidia bacterium]
MKIKKLIHYKEHSFKSAKRLIIYFIVFLFVFPACKSLQLPLQGNLKKFPLDYGVNTDTVNIANKPYSAFYNDDYLNNLIDIGIKNNYDLLILMQRIEASVAQYKFYKNNLLPKI